MSDIGEKPQIYFHLFAVAESACRLESITELNQSGPPRDVLKDNEYGRP